MAKLIGEVKELHGDFVLRSAEGEIRMLAVGDRAHLGDTIVGMQWNSPDAMLSLTLEEASEDVTLHADESLVLDATFLGTFVPLDDTDPLLSTDVLTESQETSHEDEPSQAETSSSNDQPPEAVSEGISTSEFATHDDNADNIIAHLLDNLKEPLIKDDSLDLSTAQNVTGIMDLSSAIASHDAPLVIADSDPGLKSVHKEFLLSALDRTDSEQSSDLDPKESISDQDGHLIGTIESIEDIDSSSTDTDSIYQIAFDDLSIDESHTQVADGSVKSLSIVDVLELTTEDRTTLRINGDGSDTVDLDKGSDDESATQWTKAAENLLGDDGNIYDIYTGTNDTDSVTLQIDQNIIVTDF